MNLSLGASVVRERQTQRAAATGLKTGDSGRFANEGRDRGIKLAGRRRMERARFERAMRPLAIRAAAGPAARPWPATRTRAPLRLLGRFRRGRLRRYRRPSTRRRSPARWHADAGRIGWSGRWFRRDATDA